MGPNDFQFHLDQRFDWRFLRNKTEFVHVVLPGTSAATAGNYGVFWIAPRSGTVSEVWETHQVLGTDAGAVTLDLEILTSGKALDAGYSPLFAPFNLKASINVPRQATLKEDVSKRQFERGDRLALKDVGTLTAVAHVCVMVAVTFKS